MYAALLACRPIVAATANVNPAALRTKRLLEQTLDRYKSQQATEPQPEEAADAP